jgi:hypothetical protein
MGSNKLLEIGSKRSQILFFKLGFIKVKLTTLYFITIKIKSKLLFSSMFMMFLSLAIILITFKKLKTILKVILLLKILGN